MTGETGKEVWVFNIMFGKDVIIGDMCQELNDWQLRYANSIAPSTSKFIKFVTFNSTCAQTIFYGLRTDTISAIEYLSFEPKIAFSIYGSEKT